RTERKVLATDAADHTRYNPAAGDVVDHRVFFREGKRLLADPERVTQNRDLAVFRASRKGGGHHDGGRHHPVSRLVMLVDGNPVEAQFRAELELVEVAVVELVSLLRIVLRVRHDDPSRSV